MLLSCHCHSTIGIRAAHADHMACAYRGGARVSMAVLGRVPDRQDCCHRQGMCHEAGAPHHALGPASTQAGQAENEAAGTGCQRHTAYCIARGIRAAHLRLLLLQLQDTAVVFVSAQLYLGKLLQIGKLQQFSVVHLASLVAAFS